LISSNDPRVAERAAMLALLMKENAAALDLAQRWRHLAPGSEQARTNPGAGVVAQWPVEEASGYLETVRRAASKKDQAAGLRHHRFVAGSDG
jgi:hypothetical protein